MKYAIQASCYIWSNITDSEYEEWNYVGVEGKHKIFIFEEDVTKKTKIFDSATEAGEYVDKHFGADKVRLSYSGVRIVEI